MQTVLLSITLVFFAFSAATQDLYFPPTSGNEWQTTTIEELGWCEEALPELISFLEETSSRSFMLLKDGKIVIEEYFNGHARDSVWYWASAGKTITAVEIGILQEEGEIDINQPSSSYLGEEWTNCTAEQEQKILVRHQLDMTTGLDYTISNSDCTDRDCLDYLNPPATQWYYHNAPYTLLGDIITNITGRTRTIHTYLALGLKTGITGQWIPTGAYNRTFFSKTRSMARFGLLINNRGTWDGEPILNDADYFQDMVSSSQDINPSYGYLWWLNSGPNYRLPGSTITFPGKILKNAPDHLLMALGKNSQVIMVDTIANVVLIRTGEDPDPSAVPIQFTNDLWDKAQAIMCSSTATKEELLPTVSIFPNPSVNTLFVKSTHAIDKIQIFDVQGKQVLHVSNDSEINTSSLLPGSYQVVITSKGNIFSESMIKL